MLSTGKYKIIFVVLLLVASEMSLYPEQRRMLGAQAVPSLASSYLTLESRSAKVKENASWAYASGVGIFFDYKLNPFISIRFDWFVFPALINEHLDKSGENVGIIKLQEAGLTVKRHFEGNIFDPWFGGGLYSQYTNLNEFNSYVLHVLLSAGVDYEISEDVFFCPELKFGLGMQIISSDEETVTVELPTGSDFSTSGLIIFLKLGIAKSF